MSATVYDTAVQRFLEGRVDWQNDTFKVLLATSDYQPDASGDDSRLDVIDAEVKPSGTYVRGGAPLTGRDISRPFPLSVRLTAGRVSWDGFTGSFRYAVVYQAVGDPALDTLIVTTDLGFQSASNARVTLEYDRDGVCEFNVMS